MSGELAGRTALVCGASAGIGEATALALAAKGAAIVGLARRADRLDALRPRLLAAGAPDVAVVVADLDDTDGILKAVRGVSAEILIHNTGGPPGGRLRDDVPDKLLAAFRRHVLSAQVLLKHLLPGMEAAGFGRIVTVTSTSVREPLDHLGTSNVIRAAMAGWVKTLSRELPAGVTINNVLPGYTDTERLGTLIEGAAERGGSSVEAVRAAWAANVPEGRLADASEIASVIAFLCTPAAGYVRGVALPVDGGRLRSI